MDSIKLLPHQQEALELTKGMNNVAYYYDMGLGKTFIGSEKMKQFNNRYNLIICQKSKISDWIEHMKQYDVTVYNLTKPAEFKKFMYEWYSCVDGYRINTHVGVINYELAWRRTELNKLKNFTMMLDESSLIQNRKAKQTKFILKLKPSNVILLSGTPTGGKYENLWTQGHLLGWAIKETLYQKQYVNWVTMNLGGVTFKVVDKKKPYKNIERLKSKLREYGAVFKKSDECFNLPEQVFQTINVESTKEYKTFLKTSYVIMEDKELTGDTTLTKMLYSRQLCGQYNKNKLTAVKELLESSNDRFIIFYSFNDELQKLKDICESLNRPISEVNGHCKDLTAYEQEENSVTLCQYQSASKGLNLQKSKRIIYFTLPLSSEDFEQSKKRTHRIGQTDTCFYYMMICKDSVEEKIYQTLEKRQNYTERLFEDEV